MKEVVIQLNRAEVVYDLQFATNRIARLVSLDKDGKQTKINSSISAEGKDNDDYVNRLITSAVSELRSNTAWANAEKSGSVVDNNLSEKIGRWVFVFKVPMSWRGNTQVLGDKIHEYVSNKVTAGWLKMVAPGYTQTYREEADSALNDIKHELRKDDPEKTEFTQL